ncbi:MAG: di-heme oxidoredictase family protein, partial [Planctomycetota bacterium]
LVLVVGFAVFARAAEPLPDPSELSAGQKLFTHQFRAQDPLTPGGDGLGPLHNEVSCAGCHRQKGIGGAGPLQKNVDVIIRLPITGQQSEKSKQERASRAAELHPGLLSNPSQGVATILHRSATTEGYAAWRAKLLGAKLSDRASFADVVRAEEALDDHLQRTARSVEFKTHGLAMQRVQRSTPALFGAGLIDQIPDAVIIAQAQALAQSTKHRSLGIQGVVPTAVPERPDPLGDPQQIQNQPRAVVGKFGWRGQTGSLRQFVLNACANELGLEIPNHAQPTHPQRTDYSPPGFDLSRQQCEELIEFVAQLPRPQQELPTDPSERQLVERGEALFARIGCAACHVPKLGNVDGLYTDLLLHDLGKDLSDFAGANPSRPFTGGGIPGFNFSPLNFEQLVQFYTGGVFTESPELRQKWKTPPLWGVRDSAPYMHDGRAATLDEAIRLHAGEAKQVTQAYKALSGLEREQLLAFLNTLAAPMMPPVTSPL